MASRGANLVRARIALALGASTAAACVGFSAAAPDRDAGRGDAGVEEDHGAASRFCDSVDAAAVFCDDFDRSAALAAEWSPNPGDRPASMSFVAANDSAKSAPNVLAFTTPPGDSFGGVEYHTRTPATLVRCSADVRFEAVAKYAELIDLRWSDTGGTTPYRVTLSAEVPSNSLRIDDSVHAPVFLTNITEKAVENGWHRFELEVDLVKDTAVARIDGIAYGSPYVLTPPAGAAKVPPIMTLMIYVVNGASGAWRTSFDDVIVEPR